MKIYSIATAMLVIILTLSVNSAAEASLEPKGYQARSCGLDMNRNGRFGEKEDCQVCNGITLDPDFDGINEDMIYIDCQAGTDALDCGSPNNPCRTITYAWTERADGPEDGAEDILCFRQVCTAEENIASGVSGVPGFYTKARSGSEERDWEWPQNPTMLIGWDSDGDGRYPPVDKDDIAVLDGGPEGLTRAFHFNRLGVRSYIEMAHFTAKNYGTYSLQTKDRGFLRAGLYGRYSSHVFLHDLELIDINRGLASQSSTSIFNFFRGGTAPRWWMFSNIKITGMSSWLVRGSGPNNPDKENGPYRFQNLSVEAMGCPYEICGRTASTTMFKLWGYVSGIEIIDNIFDLNADAWKPGGNPSHGITPAQCSRDWTIRNNTFTDFQKVLNIKGYARNNCDGEAARTTDDILFDSNLVENTYDWGSYGNPNVLILQGNSERETIEDVTVINNIFTSTQTQVACLWVSGGNRQGPNPGTITFVGNTCSAPYKRYAAIMIGHPTQDEAPFPHERMVIENNLIDDVLPGQNNVWLEYVPAELEMDFNVFDPEARFNWLGNKIESLAEWQGLANCDLSSNTCEAKFQHTGNGGLFRLNPSDSCARDAGKPRPEVSTMDREGDQRGLDGAWDVGADEYLLGQSRSMTGSSGAT